MCQASRILVFVCAVIIDGLLETSTGNGYIYNCNCNSTYISSSRFKDECYTLKHI